MTDRPEVRCPMCGARVWTLLRMEYRDAYWFRCPCVGYAAGNHDTLVTVVDYPGLRVPRLHKRWAGWHLRWTAMACRERAEAWQRAMWDQ